ncbi:MAG: hypothetical protein JW712_07405 [Dehalococcoidales bacterium]|nr:hypothetical protein [Dehalococcoidales bacterium]
MLRSKDWLTILAAGCLVLVSIALLLAHNSPASGYEIDIYASTPRMVWIFIILSFIGGTAIILHQVLTREYRGSRFWLIGLLVILVARIALLYVPFVRGYYAWDGDNITHFGIIKDLVLSGHIPGNLYYPVTHTIVTEGIMITGMNDLLLSNLSTGFFSILFVLSTYLLSTAVLPGRGQQILATMIAGSVMIAGSFNFLMFANGWSILFLPMLFYYLFNLHRGWLYTFILILFLVLYPYFHPLSSLMVIVGLFIIEITTLLIKYYASKKGMDTAGFTLKSLLIPLAIETIIFVPWVFSFSIFASNIRLFWEQIISFGGTDVLADIGDTLDKVNVQGFEIVILFIKMYAAEASFIILSLLTLLFLFRKLHRKDINRQTPSLIGLGFVFGFFGFLYLLYTVGAPGFYSIGGSRILTFTVIFTPVFVAYMFDLISRWQSVKKWAFPILAVATIVPSILSILQLFPSPYFFRPNVQMTHMDKAGITWYWEQKSRDMVTYVITTQPERLAHLIYGRNNALSRPDILTKTPYIADHFGYDENANAGDSFSQDEYLVMPELSRTVYLTLWEDVGRFNESDFEKFYNDPTVNRLYTNGEFETYLVTGTGTDQS